MPIDRRKRNLNWFITTEQGKVYNAYGQYECAILATLMDIRGELQALRTQMAISLAATNDSLRGIKKNTTKAKRKRKA